ncbi:MAG: hypothetical protein AB1629_01080 [Candidatus Omnitrophota bacterium]
MKMALKYETLAKFKSKKGGDVYFVKRKLSTGELSCNCKGWLYYRHCKHIDYVKSNSFIELTDIPTHQEALRMGWGKNLEEKEKWTVAHLKAIEL